MNRGLSIREINKSIKAISKHQSLQSIKLKIDVDPKVLQTLQKFNANLNNVNQSVDKQTKLKEASTVASNKEADAVRRVTQAMKERNVEQKKTFKDAFDNVTGTQTTHGNGNTKQIVNADATGGVLSTIDIENQKKDLADYNKLLDQAYRDNVKFNKKSEALEKTHYLALKTNKAKKEALDKMHYQALKLNRERDLAIKNVQLKEAETLDRAHYMALKNDQDRKLAKDKMYYTALEMDRKRDLALQKQYQTMRNSMEVSSQRMLLMPRASKSGINNIMTELNSVKKVTPQVVARGKELQQSLRLIGVQAAGAAVSTNSMAGAFKNALVKFPIWMAASTAFFGVIAGIRSSIQNIIEIDKQMVSLMRVSNGELERANVLKSSFAMAEKLGNKVVDINKGLEDFAKQGFRGEGLVAMTEAATLFSNISDMDVGEAASGLTAAVKGFNILPENILGIVDSINEVDNSFSISSANIVQSIQKSVGAANSFGVSMEKLIGYTTAIGQVTRESGNIVGNSLKTIFSRITTMSGSINALNDLNISVKNMQGELRPVSDILDELAGKWGSLNAETQQSIGLQIAGRLTFKEAS